jgi:hypothetical protein
MTQQHYQFSKRPWETRGLGNPMRIQRDISEIKVSIKGMDHNLLYQCNLKEEMSSLRPTYRDSLHGLLTGQ